MLSLLLATGWATGCSRVPEAAHGTLVLDALVDHLPVLRSDRRDAAQPYGASTTFRLPAAVPHADLILEGLWWTGEVTVNGHALPPVTGGYAPVAVPVGGWLKDGENTIALKVTPPGDTVDSVQDGELRAFAPLAGPPRLVLHGAGWVEDAGIVGGRARARVGDPPSGSRVAFSLWDKGAKLADLADATVVSGVASVKVPEGGVPGWDVGAPALVWLRAVLKSGDAVLDDSAFRTGAATIGVGARGMTVNGKPRPLAGLRWSGGPVDGDLQWLGATGLDTLELHGQPITDALLDATDEAGVGVVIVPRCDGRIRQGGGTRRPVGNAGASSWESPLLDAQDARALTAVLRHPSVLLWAMEANQAQQPARIASIAEDGRPVAGRDLPLLHTTPGANAAGGWQIEYTADVANPEQVLADALSVGATGGILPGPPGRTPEAWIASVKAALETANLPIPVVRVGPGRVEASGLKAGDVVWVEQEGGDRVGAIAGTDGRATVPVRWTGEGTATLPNGSQAVKVTAGTLTTVR